MKSNSGTEMYGLEQSNHGHLYRWIFTKERLLEQGIEPHDEDCVDILFPIGGSNSSATYFTKLNTEEDIRNFLLPGYYTDYDDPMLIDIAEGIFTIDTDYRIWVSKTAKENYTSEVFDDFFGRYEGKVIKLPERFLPSKEMIEYHNSKLVNF